jgi:hypothetical protein
VASARATIFWIAFGCDRCASRLFAAGLLLVKDQIPRNEGCERPFGPAGDLARLTQRRFVNGPRTHKESYGRSVVASDKVSYVTGSVLLVAGQFTK